MDISVGGIAQFFNDRAADLRQIARGTKGEIEVSEVESEAWLAAVEIEKKRGYRIDFTDAADQQTLLARLYNRLVKYAEKHIRYAVKLDTDWDREESTAFGAVLARLLTAPTTADPLVQLQQRQDSKEVAVAVQRSYSQASAYVILLTRFEWEAKELADHLRISVTTLKLRLKRSGVTVKVQPSLFDGIEIICPDFLPLILRRANQIRVHLIGEQSIFALCRRYVIGRVAMSLKPDRPLLRR